MLGQYQEEISFMKQNKILKTGEKASQLLWKGEMIKENAIKKLRWSDYNQIVYY